MYRLLTVLFFATILPLHAIAQDAPRAEVFGGFQYFRAGTGTGSINDFNLNGWDASLSGYFNRYLGVTADFSGAYESGFKFHTYTFGPVVSAHLPIAKPFVHALFGGATASGGGTSSTGFDMMLGGGLDVGHGSLAWRVVQADWMITRFSGFTDKKNSRVSTGIVLRF